MWAGHGSPAVIERSGELDRPQVGPKSEALCRTLFTCFAFVFFTALHSLVSSFIYHSRHSVPESTYKAFHPRAWCFLGRSKLSQSHARYHSRATSQLESITCFCRGARKLSTLSPSNDLGLESNLSAFLRRLSVGSVEIAALSNPFGTCCVRAVWI